jgi:hypothetical protein
MSSTAFDIMPKSEAPKFALTLFTVDEFFGFWKELEKMLDMVPHTWRHWTKEYICHSIAHGTMQIWGVGKPPEATLIIFTSVSVFPTMKVLNITWAAGKFEDDMLPLLDATFDNYAAMNGCSEIEIRGRDGWMPKLKRLGFESEARVWTRPVRHGRLN